MTNKIHYLQHKATTFYNNVRRSLECQCPSRMRRWIARILSVTCFTKRVKSSANSSSDCSSKCMSTARTGTLTGYSRRNSATSASVKPARRLRMSRMRQAEHAGKNLPWCGRGRRRRAGPGLLRRTKIVVYAIRVACVWPSRTCFGPSDRRHGHR